MDKVAKEMAYTIITREIRDADLANIVLHAWRPQELSKWFVLSRAPGFVVLNEQS